MTTVSCVPAFNPHTHQLLPLSMHKEIARKKHMQKCSRIFSILFSPLTCTYTIVFFLKNMKEKDNDDTYDKSLVAVVPPFLSIMVKGSSSLFLLTHDASLPKRFDEPSEFDRTTFFMGPIKGPMMILFRLLKVVGPSMMAPTLFDVLSVASGDLFSTAFRKSHARKSTFNEYPKSFLNL